MEREQMKKLLRQVKSGKLDVGQALQSPVEVEKLLRIEDRLRERVVGQDESLTAVGNAVRRSRAGRSRGLSGTGRRRCRTKQTARSCRARPDGVGLARGRAGV